MSKKFYILNIFCICILCNAFAQETPALKIFKKELSASTNDQQRLNLYLGISAEYFKSNAAMELQSAMQALALATKLKANNETIADCHYYIGQGYRVKNEFVNAIEHLKQADSLYKNSDNQNKIAVAEHELSVNYYYTGKYDEALQFANNALSVYELLKNDTAKADILTHLGYIYQSKLNYTKALQCFSQSLHISEKLNLGFYRSQNLIAIGMYYIQRKDFENAKLYYNQAIALLDPAEGIVAIARYKSVLGLIEKNLWDYKHSFQDLQFSIQVLSKNNDYRSVCFAYQNMGDLFNAMKKPAQALPYELLSLDAFYHIQDEIGIADQCFNVGYTFSLMNKDDSAFLYFQKGLQLAKEKNLSDVKKNCYQYLAALYAKHNDLKNALLYQTKFMQQKDLLAGMEENNKLTELQAQFETERKEKEITLLKKDQQLTLSGLQKQKTFQYAAYIIFSLVVFIGGLIINRYRTVQRAKRMIEIEQMRNNIARNLHDDIGSTLTSINILSKVALQKTETNGVANTNMQKIKDRSAAIMESMNDIVWAINPANDALDKIILRMKEFGAETLEPAGMQFIFTEEGELDDVKLSLPQRNNLYLIFKEALNNAVKYSEAKKVNILFKREPGNLILKITDDGKGFNAQQQYSGNGLKNMQSRADDMKAKIELRSIPGSGTLVYLFVPIT
ncbi:MAG: tetratricopeptide repeat protein [Ferruginibacter sp.]